MFSPLPSLEDVEGCAAVAATWERFVGTGLSLFQQAFLQKSAGSARFYPCPHECGCDHQVQSHPNGKIVAVCQCESWNCDDIALKKDQLTIYELSWPKVGRAIAKAFNCQHKDADMGFPHTRQIASFGAADIPIILTIQSDQRAFRNAINHLAVRLRERFAVLSPTNRFLDATSQAVLQNCKAQFFDLATVTTVQPNGALQGLKTGGELFSPLLPENEDAVKESEASRLFALMKSLDDGPKKRKAPLGKVFRLLVLEENSQEETARKCKCVPSLITLRVKAIEIKMGRPIDELCAFASRLAEKNTSVKDPRARSIYNKGLTDDTGNRDEE